VQHCISQPWHVPWKLWRTVTWQQKWRWHCTHGIPLHMMWGQNFDKFAMAIMNICCCSVSLVKNLWFTSMDTEVEPPGTAVDEEKESTSGNCFVCFYLYACTLLSHWLFQFHFWSTPYCLQFLRLFFIVMTAFSRSSKAHKMSCRDMRHENIAN